MRFRQHADVAHIGRRPDRQQAICSVAVAGTAAFGAAAGLAARQAVIGALLALCRGLGLTHWFEPEAIRALALRPIMAAL